MRWSLLTAAASIAVGLGGPLGGVGPVAAGAQPSPAVAVLVAPDDLAVVRDRILGQTADLPWDVRTDPMPLPGPPADAAIEALARGARAGARVVVWVARPEDGAGPGLRLFAVDVETRRFLKRDIQVRGGRNAASAAAESVALVVRTVLSTLEQGGDLETDERVATSDDRPAAPPASTADASETPPPDGETPGDGRAPAAGSDDPDIPPPARRRRVVFRGQAGWALALDGGADPVATGAAASVGVALDDVRIDLRTVVGLSLPAQGASEVRLRRSIVELVLGGPVVRWPGGMDLALRGGLGMGIYGVRVPQNLVGGPTTVREAGVTASADAVWRIPLGGPWILGIELGALLFPRRPDLEILEGGVLSDVADLWLVQPRAALQLALDLDLGAPD